MEGGKVRVVGQGMGMLYYGFTSDNVKGCESRMVKGARMSEMIAMDRCWIVKAA